MHAQLDDLLTATYVLVDDFLPKRRGPGRPPRITDAELITLAIAQVFMGLPNDRQFLALAGYRLSHLFAYLPRQSGYNKRLRALTPQIERAINYLAFCSPGWCDQLRLLDSTPVPLRGLARDGSALRVRGDRSLRLLPLSLALLLGLSPLSALRERRDPDRLRARPGKCSRARGRARDARAGPARRPHRHRRQGLRRRRARGLDGRSRSRVPSSRSQGRAAPIRIARARAPVDRIGLLDLQGTARPRASTAPAHSRACAPASGCGSSPSPPGSGITPRSVNLAGASAPIATNSGSTIY